MDVVEATTPIQICSGIPSGVEAAVHAVRSMFDDPNTEGVLLVDASNAFNSMNRSVALKNIQVTCPQFSTFMINTYRTPAKLLVRNSDEALLSEEGAMIINENDSSNYIQSYDKKELAVINTSKYTMLRERPL